VLGGAARSMSLYTVALISSFAGSGSQSAVAELDYFDRNASNHYDVIVSGSVESGSVRKLIDLSARGGTLIQLQPELQPNTMSSEKVPLTRLYEKNVSLIASKPSLLSHMRTLLSHLEKTQLDLSCINTHKADFAEADQHFLKDTTKVVVHRPRLFAH